MTTSRGDVMNYLVLYFIEVSPRLIKVVKDRIRTVHEEDRLQDLLISVAALRKRDQGHKASNFNIQDLKVAVRGILQI